MYEDEDTVFSDFQHKNMSTGLQKSDDLIKQLLLQMRQYQNQQDFYLTKKMFTPVKTNIKKNNQFNKKQWKSFILPQVNDFYDNIKSGSYIIPHKQNQKQLQHNYSEDKIFVRKKSKGSNISDKKEQNSKQFQNMKNYFVEKVKTLEHQNQNLKEELFYLRAALLAKSNIIGENEKQQIYINREKQLK